MLLMTSNNLNIFFYSIFFLKIAYYHRLVADVGNVFRAIDVDHDIRAVVISGNGRMFTAGLDCKYHNCKISRSHTN